MKKFTLYSKKYVLIAVIGLGFAFLAFHQPEEPTVFIQNTLTHFYNNDAESKPLKKVDINITNTGFCRYRKTFANGKQEYFAFNLSKLKDMDYYGTTNKGDLYLRTKNDDVIVQTRNDRNGDIDSMGTYLIIHLKNIDADQLNALSENFKKLKENLTTLK